MTISIQRLELKDGRVFEVSKLWPGDEKIQDPAMQHLQVVVGPIFLLPQVTEDVEYEPDEPAKPASSLDEDEDDDVDSRLEEVPARYEVWCVNEAMYLAFFGGFKGIGVQVDREALIKKMQGTTMMRFVVYTDAVIGHFEEWPTVVAYEAMWDRMKAQQEEQSKPSPAPPANGSARAQV